MANMIDQADESLPRMYTRLIKLVELNHRSKKVVIVTYGSKRWEEFTSASVGGSTWT